MTTLADQNYLRTAKYDYLLGKFISTRKIRTLGNQFFMVREDDGTITFWYGRTKYYNDPSHRKYVSKLATMTPDSILTMHSADDAEWGFLPGHTSRFYCLTGVYIRSDAGRFRNYEQTVRVCRGLTGRAWDTRGSLPFTEGLQFLHGKMLNPEICVDKKYTTDRRKAKALRQQMRDAVLAAQMSIRLSEEKYRSFIPHKDLPPANQLADYLHNDDLPALADAIEKYGLHYVGWYGREHTARVGEIKVERALMVATGARYYVEVPSQLTNSQGA